MLITFTSPAAGQHLLGGVGPSCGPAAARVTFTSPAAAGEEGGVGAMLFEQGEQDTRRRMQTAAGPNSHGQQAQVRWGAAAEQRASASVLASVSDASQAVWWAKLGHGRAAASWPAQTVPWHSAQSVWPFGIAVAS